MMFVAVCGVSEGAGEEIRLVVARSSAWPPFFRTFVLWSRTGKRRKAKSLST